MLLDDRIYHGKEPEEVRGHHFVYEIVEVNDNGKDVELQYKNMVIKEGGSRFRVYKETDESQVSSFLSCTCSILLYYVSLTLLLILLLTSS